MRIQPSLKTLYAGYAAIAILAAAIAIYWTQAAITEVPMWVPLLAPAALLLWAAGKHVARRTVALVAEGERIRYEAGLFPRTSWVMELAKVQDVRMDQSFGQRLIDVGDLSLARFKEADAQTASKSPVARAAGSLPAIGGWRLLDQGIFAADSIPQIAIPTDGSIYYWQGHRRSSLVQPVSARDECFLGVDQPGRDHLRAAGSGSRLRRTNLCGSPRRSK